MSERYSKLFALPKNLHTSGSPIVIVAGALLKDTQIGNVIAQLKFKNISPKNIKALVVRIRAKDISGVDVEGVDNFQYLDLNVYRDSEFGAKTPIVLPNAVARSFSCECLSAVFSDGTNWVCAEDAKWDVLPSFISLEGQLGTDLAEQYKRDTGSKSKYTITEHDDLWYCTCGAINHSNERVCHSCNLNKSTLLAALDTDTLTANKEKFEEEEAARRAEEAARQAEMAARRKKKLKTAAVIASVVVLALAIGIGIYKLITEITIEKMIALHTREDVAMLLGETSTYSGDYFDRFEDISFMGAYYDVHIGYYGENIVNYWYMTTSSTDSNKEDVYAVVSKLTKSLEKKYGEYEVSKSSKPNYTDYIWYVKNKKLLIRNYSGYLFISYDSY